MRIDRVSVDKSAAKADILPLRVAARLAERNDHEDQESDSRDTENQPKTDP